MPLDTAKIDDLKASIALARKKELAYALCLGKSPEGTIIITHKTRSSEVLGKQARKEGETPKICYGTMSVSGKVLQLTSMIDPPPGCDKHVKKFLSLAGLPMKVVITDPSGAAMSDGDGEEEEEMQMSRGPAEAAPETMEAPTRSAPAEPVAEPETSAAPADAAETETAEAPAAAPEADPVLEKAQKAMSLLAPRVEKPGDRNPEVQTAIMDLWRRVQTSVDAGDGSSAIGLLKTLAEDVAKADAGPAGEPAAGGETGDDADAMKRVNAEFNALVPRLKEVLADPAFADRATIAADVKAFRETVKGGPVVTAQETLARISAALNGGSAGASPEVRQKRMSDLAALEKGVDDLLAAFG